MAPASSQRDAVRWLLQLPSVALALLTWELIAHTGIVPRPLFPPPSAVTVALWRWAQSGALFVDLAASLWHAVLGYAIGAAAGVSIGIVSGRSAWFHAAIGPILQVLRPVPPVAIIPFVILWFGIGEAAKVWSTAYAVFLPVWVSTHLGTSNVPELYVWSARALGVSRLRELLQVVLPASLVNIAVGLRVGISVAFVMVFVTELAGASSGLGYQIAASQAAYRVDRMMAALAVLSGAGALADHLQSLTLHWLCPWLRLVKET